MNATKESQCDTDPDKIYLDNYWKCVISNVKKTATEIYEICRDSKNDYVCKELMNVYQNLAYDFCTLYEWMGNYYVNNQEAPLPRQISNLNLESEDEKDFDKEKCKTIVKPLKKSKNGINVLAPSFVPMGIQAPVNDLQTNFPVESHSEEFLERYNAIPVSMNITQMSDFQGGIIHVSQLPHFHVGSNIIPLPTIQGMLPPSYSPNINYLPSHLCSYNNVQYPLETYINIEDQEKKCDENEEKKNPEMKECDKLKEEIITEDGNEKGKESVTKSNISEEPTILLFDKIEFEKKKFQNEKSNLADFPELENNFTSRKNKNKFPRPKYEKKKKTKMGQIQLAWSEKCKLSKRILHTDNDSNIFKTSITRIPITNKGQHRSPKKLFIQQFNRYAPNRNKNTEAISKHIWKDSQWENTPRKQDITEVDGWQTVRTRYRLRENSARFKREQLGQTFCDSKKTGHKRFIPNSKPLPNKNYQANKKMENLNIEIQSNSSPLESPEIPEIYEDVSFENSISEEEISQKSDITVQFNFDVSSQLAHLSSTENSPNAVDPECMHREFLQYLEYVTDTAQTEEINKFQNIISQQCPEQDSDELVTVEKFKSLILSNPVVALDLRKEIHEKLRQIMEAEFKQQQAYEKRQQLLQCKTAKVRGFVKKVEEVKAAKYKKALERKSQIDLKLKKAEENRKLHLSIIKKKAHDEEEKLREIAFINELEAQNRRHDSLALRQEHEERLQYLVEERHRKLEEKAAREAAVEERRRVLEAERQAKLQEMSEKRKKKEEFIDRKQQEREKERLEIAREKAREREERLLARQAAQLANAEELQKRIQQKQEESARRHEENIEQIRQKALEVGLHKNLDDATGSFKMEDTKTEQDNHSEQYKQLKNLLKKRFKKIKKRLISRSESFIKKEKHQAQNGKMNSAVNDIKIILDSPDNMNKLAVTLDIKLSNILELLKNQTKNKQLQFCACNGYCELTRVIKAFTESHKDRLNQASLKSMVTLIKVSSKATEDNEYNLNYILRSNYLIHVLDLMLFCLSKIIVISLRIIIKDQLDCQCAGLTCAAPTSEACHFESHFKTLFLQDLKYKSNGWFLLCKELNTLVSQLLLDLHNNLHKESEELDSSLSDFISYFICSGLVHVIGDLFKVAIIDDLEEVHQLLPSLIQVLVSLFNKRYFISEMITVLKVTDCIGSVHLLYEALQKHVAMLTQNANQLLPSYTLDIINMLKKFAQLDLRLFQDILGDDGMDIQIRGIASMIMSYYTKCDRSEELLMAMVDLVGYFALHNSKNQMLIQSGKQPSVLQQLVRLPFKYFCQQEYINCLFPTLYACAYNNIINKAIVDEELDYSSVEKFVNSDVGKHTSLMKLFSEIKN